jgi:2-polyprenyl-3-methyl-5-hydroxy-6-metoxy-1,4-benzoquinol methylase
MRMHVLGLAYLLFHPSNVKRIIIRETRYGRRYESREGWLKWQEYDQYIAHVTHSSAEAQARPVNVDRIQTISDMVKSVGSNLQILDIGCGPAVISQHLYEMGNKVACADLPAITPLAHKHRDLLVVAADAEHLAFAADSLDVILASEILEHLWSPHDFLKESYRILRANGHVIIEVPEGKEGLRWDAHIQFFTVESLAELAEYENFSTVKVKRVKPDVGCPTPTIIVLLRKK